MGYCLWEPKRIKNVEQDCPRLNSAKGKVVPMKKLKCKSKRKHLICDYAHVLPKLHCHWDDETTKKRNEISPRKIYHGLHSTNVTERLNPKPPSHAAHPSLIDAPTEYHGRQAQDVTEMYTFASRGKKPPSRDHYYGREATDISEFLRIIPPVAKEGDESNEFFGRPKSDVTDFNRFPIQTIDTKSRSEVARPLGRCAPGPMCDYVALTRDKNGKLVKPQPIKPPSPLCESGTHELPLPTTIARRHQLESEQQFVPGAGGILAQIVPGFSRSEAKKPVGRGVPGVMADYVQLERDENGKVITHVHTQPWHSPRAQSPCISQGEEPHNKDNKKFPLGKVPVGVMHDFVPNPNKGKYKHTTDGYWAPPLEYPPTPPCIDNCAFETKQSCQDQLSEALGLTSPTKNTQDVDYTLKRVKKRLKKDRRRNAICEMHEPGCPLAAEQGHVGSCISHPAISSYVKWPKEGELEQGPCKKHGGRTSIFKVKGSPCSAIGSNVGSAQGSVDGKEGSILAGSTCDSKPRSSATTSMVGSRHGSQSPCSNYSNSINMSMANQSPLRPDTACPRVACECIRVTNKGTGSPSYGYEESISRLDPKYAKKVARPDSGSSSSLKSVSTTSKVSKGSLKSKKNSMAFVTEETSPQHFQVPYFGLAQTYVTNPAISPNITPPLRRGARPVPQVGQENISLCAMAAGVPSGHEHGRLGRKTKGFFMKDEEVLKSCNSADVCKHHHNGKMAWFGRSKTFVTDPAISPNLTPPCFKSFT